LRGELFLCQYAFVAHIGKFAQLLQRIRDAAVKLMEKSVQSYSYRFAAQPRAASTIVLVAALSPRRLAAAAPCYAASRCKSATAWFCECSSNSSKC
jgi:hypothetical protein